MAEVIVENPPRKDPDLPVVEAPAPTPKAAAVEEKKPVAKEEPKAQSSGGLRFGQGRR